MHAYIHTRTNITQKNMHTHTDTTRTYNTHMHAHKVTITLTDTQTQSYNTTLVLSLIYTERAVAAKESVDHEGCIARHESLRAKRDGVYEECVY